MNSLVIGCGAWGTTIAKLLSKNNKEVFINLFLIISFFSYILSIIYANKKTI